MPFAFIAYDHYYIIIISYTNTKWIAHIIAVIVWSTFFMHITHMPKTLSLSDAELLLRIT